MGEPTITVTQDPCPVCDGSRRLLRVQEVVTQGRFRQKTTPAEYYTCETCQGAGKLVMAVPISRLLQLSAEPARFAEMYRLGP